MNQLSLNLLPADIIYLFARQSPETYAKINLISKRYYNIAKTRSLQEICRVPITLNEVLRNQKFIVTFSKPQFIRILNNNVLCSIAQIYMYQNDIIIEESGFLRNTNIIIYHNPVKSKFFNNTVDAITFLYNEKYNLMPTLMFKILSNRIGCDIQYIRQRILNWFDYNLNLLTEYKNQNPLLPNMNEVIRFYLNTIAADLGYPIVKTTEIVNTIRHAILALS